MKTIIKNPRITEKSTTVMSGNVYVFDIGVRANKIEIKKKIFELYKVKPVKVNLLAVPKKRVSSRRSRGNELRGGGRKAFVYLKKGESIKF